MKTRIEVTWPRATPEETAKLYGISEKRQKEIQELAEESLQRVLADRKAKRAEARKAKAA